MALFHFHVDQIGRSAGRSAVACAAYRSGEKLYSEYYGETSDYTRKGGVMYSEIMLPPHAPMAYADRQTLWNAVEKAERRHDAQLAYSFDIALQNELTFEENLEVARAFLLQYFVGDGMTVDFCVHDPERDGIQNPHFHVMVPIRPLNPDGTWGAKQHRVYHLDENGERIRDEHGNYVFDAIATTDWGKPETLELWREQWANMVNAKFAQKGLSCRIDHRSYEDQALDILPTVHEGPVVRQMEQKGIRTEKGELNRWIKATNRILKNLKQRIADLKLWIEVLREELGKQQTSQDLVRLIQDYYGERNRGTLHLVVLVFRASGCQDHSIFRQCLGKFGIVFPALGTAVTARHHNELFDRAAFYRIDHLIRQSQNLRVCKSADQLSCFNFSRCSASFCVFNDNGKILLLPDFSWDMGTSRISCCASSVESVFVAVFRRHDAVGRHQDRTVEGFKFLLLLPPRIAVVTDKVGILFECRVIVGREHLGMGINIHAGSLCLLQQHFQIPQVVTGNQNTGICPNANIYLRNFGISIGFRVGLVQQSHTGYAVFSGFHCQSNQFF